eukprot:CAMPEP_0194238490 /NCGR_PEP_ID=MMETSP0158-20130606/5227_1 /TAXON_ID=33649 /ORGANISM="Thalassionema nitzschioides, Strain L26-B" /LENGTH=329 /DNA_ID=CAMNT_0038972757 /DNA_START=9 /DNA_END=998 /DNA_ORIENTATION=+
MISSSSTSTSAVKMCDTSEREAMNKKLFTAITTNKPDFTKIRQLLIDGADANYVTRGFPKSNLKCTPLASASYYGHESVANILLKFGANVDGETNTEAPLYCASRNGHIEVVDLLLQHKANVNVANSADETPLLVASANGYSNVIALLLKHGAKIDKANIFQETPLYCASCRGLSWVVAILLQHGATVDTSTFKGETPLDIANLNGHVRIAHMLKESVAENVEESFSVRAGERNKSRIQKMLISKNSSSAKEVHNAVEDDATSNPEASPKDVTSFWEKKAKKKKKKSYKAMMADMITGDGASSKRDIAREREELRKVTGGGVFSKVDKI